MAPTSPSEASMPFLANDFPPHLMPYPVAPGAPFFDRANVTEFLKEFDQICSNYRVSESEKIERYTCCQKVKRKSHQ